MPSPSSQRAILNSPLIRLAFLTIVACLVIPERALAGPVSLAIEAGEASETLQQLATQTGVNLVFSKGHVSGIRTQAVSGNLEPSKAVEWMIHGTSLGFFVDDTSGAIVVFRNQPNPNQSRERSSGGNPAVETAIHPNHQVQTVMKDMQEDMITKVAPRRNLIGAILGTIAVTVAPGLNGQESTDRLNEEDQIFELSPFEVSAADDVGYYTNSTLAGSRLNSNLLTTPSAISVFNEDFLNDISANTLYDAIGYSMAFSVDVMSDNANHEQFSNGGVNARGFPRSSNNSKDFFDSFLSTDRYNIERITFSRGPNAILFGVGNPGGIINTTTKRTRFADFNEFTFQLDEYGTIRASTDINRELIDERLAVRVNLLFDDRKDNRDFNKTGSERGHFAVTYKPFKTTTIRADFEKGNVDRVFHRRWIARDGVSDWIAAGSKAVDFDGFRNADGSINFNAARTFAGGNEAAFTNNDRMLMVYENGVLVGSNGRYEVASTGTNNMQLELIDFWGRDSGLTGPTNSSDHDLEAYSVFIEQRIGQNFFIEAAYRYEEENRWIDTIVNHTSITPRLDVAPTLPNGAANPNYEHYFIESFAQLSDQLNESESMRLTASYELEFENKWAGRHRFAGLLQRVDGFRALSRYAFANRTPLGGNRQVNPNQIVLRTYLASPGQSSGERGFMADPSVLEAAPFELLNPVTGAVVGTVTPDWVEDRRRPSSALNESWMLAGQSFWWDDRIALTYGYREDTLDQRNFVETVASAADAAANPSLLQREILDAGLGEVEIFAGETTTLGLAVQPLTWLTLTANASENFSPQNRFNIYNQNIGNVTAEGSDFSIRLSPGGGNRFFFVLNYFQTEVVNAGENLFSFFTPINQIWDTIEAGNLGPDGERIIENSGYSRDFTADGYEIELVANPTPNITLRANFTLRENEVGNVAGEVVRYLEENVPVWTPFRDVVLVDNTSLTIGDQIDLVQQRIVNVRNEIGRASSDNVRERASFFGRYQFTQGSMKGFDVGLGIRYTGARIAQYLVDADGTLQPFMTDGYTEVDLKIGYKRKIANGKVDWNLQINVQNLFNKDAAVVTQVNPNTLQARTYALIQPRVVSLSSSFRF